MNSLYPLKFKPIFKDKIWGGQKIKIILGLDFSPLPKCGEVWMISGVEGNQSIVENGYLAENELNELVEIYMSDLVGEKVFDKFGNVFPVLIKFIDSNDNLSVQVHPDDQLAKKRHGCFGKTEMWYIIQADKDAKIINGFNHEITKETYLDHLEKKTLKEILNFENAKADDVFFIPAGRVHALGAGILLAEIQQTSDVTYRIYDWNRVDEKGQSRELHTEQALEALDFKFYNDTEKKYSKELNSPVNLAKCPYFSTNLFHLTKTIERDFSQLDSFVIYVCREGSFELIYQEDKMIINKGDCILLPAIFESVTLNPQKEAKILEIYIE